MKPSPAFLFYYQDFFSDPDVVVMEKAHQADYVRLLSVQWQKGSIPDDQRKLAKLTQSTPDEWAVAWESIAPCFEPGEEEGTLQNARMKSDRDAYLDMKAARAEAGRRGGKSQAKAKQKPSKGEANVKQNGSKSQANGQAKAKLPSSSSLSSSLSSSSPSPLPSPSEEEDTFQPGAETDNSPPKPPDCPHQKIIDLYHEILPELPRVQTWRGAGRANLQTRWREDKSRQSLAWWEDFFINRVKNSGFLTGQKNDFRASLNWLVGPKNFEKVLNGQYVDRGAPTTGSARTDRNAAACKQFMEDEG